MDCKLNNGFTLAETMLTIGLSAIILTAMFSVFAIEQRALNLRSERGDDVRQGQTALRRIEKTVRDGEAVVSSASLFGITYTTGAHTVVIDVPAIDSSGVLISGETDRLAYTVSGTSLVEVSVPSASSVRPSGVFTLAEDILAFNIQTNGDPVTDSTQVIIYLSFPPPSTAATQVEGQIRATLRNI